jgi:hypothetical protein
LFEETCGAVKRLNKNRLLCLKKPVMPHEDELAPLFEEICDLVKRLNKNRLLCLKKLVMPYEDELLLCLKKSVI